MTPKENWPLRLHHFWGGRWNSKNYIGDKRGGWVLNKKIQPLLFTIGKTKKYYQLEEDGSLMEIRGYKNESY